MCVLMLYTKHLKSTWTPHTFTGHTQNTKHHRAQKPTIGWLLLSFLGFLSHGPHVVPTGVGAYGALIKNSTSLPTATPYHPRAHLNTAGLWHQWLKFCFLINALKNYKVSILISASPETQTFANALGWHCWSGSSLRWRALTVLQHLPTKAQKLAKPDLCLINFKNQIEKLNDKTWYQTPSLAINVPPQFSNGWVGLTATKQHVSLQYYLLTCVFKHLKSK